jgi:beta-glucosidase
MVLVSGGYIDGVIPPQKKDMQAASRAMVNILKAHADVYHALHSLSKSRSIRVGFAHHLRIFDPVEGGGPLDRWLARVVEEAWNWALATAPETGHFKLWLPFLISIDEEIRGLRGTQDFFGVNYYSRDRIAFTWKKPHLSRSVTPGAPVTDLGWEIYPEGMYRILRKIGRKFPNKPVVITENGIADSADRIRKQFLFTHLEGVLKAIEDGVPVEGYCHWSLIDNFEWIEGFTPRFGLYSVDYSTQQRTPRGSALLFSGIAGRNQLPGL